GNRLELKARPPAQPPLALVDLKRIEFGPDRQRRWMRSRGQQRQKRPVAAAVVDDPQSAEAEREPQSGLEAALVTPGNQAGTTEDLFGRVVPLAQDRVVRLQNLRSLASHVPRNVIQNDSAMSRRSRPNDWRRMYSRSKRNF